MMYLPRANLVYIAVPKTGGISTATVLGKYASAETVYDTNDVAKMHLPASYAKKVFPKANVVCLIREPLSWMSSKYKYLSSDMFPWGSVYTTKHQAFDKFVSRYLRGERPWPEPYRLQSDYVSGADFVFRYEEIEKFTSFLSDRLGEPIVLPRLNVSPDRDLLLSHENKEALVDVLRFDYEIWNRVGDTP